MGKHVCKIFGAKMTYFEKIKHGTLEKRNDSVHIGSMQTAVLLVAVLLSNQIQAL